MGTNPRKTSQQSNRCAASKKKEFLHLIRFVAVDLTQWFYFRYYNILLCTCQLPLLQIDGLNLVQSMAIVRYLARKHNLYGADDVEMVQCDIIAECFNDWKAQLKFNDYGEHYGVTLKKYMPRFQRFIDSNPTHSGYFVGQSVTFG